jgi:hypothetical protein
MKILLFHKDSEMMFEVTDDDMAGQKSLINRPVLTMKKI